jgi:hypothetical protein
LILKKPVTLAATVHFVGARAHWFLRRIATGEEASQATPAIVFVRLFLAIHAHFAISAGWVCLASVFALFEAFDMAA